MLVLVALVMGACARHASVEGMEGGGKPSGHLQQPAPFLGEKAPDARDFLPPPPADDSPEDLAELQIFRDTRALVGTARWEMAAQDAALKMWPVFSCALDAQVKPKDVPLTMQLIGRTIADVFPIIVEQKDFYHRQRPYTRAPGDTCVTTDNLAPNDSYPSGHSTAGWTWALLLAELVPDRAGQIIGRGRAFGESRVVCGVHYPSDVVAGQTIATAVIAALQTNPDFISGRNAARKELGAVLAVAPEPDKARCAAETEMIRQRPW